METFLHYFPLFGEALALTFQITVIGILIGIGLGLVFGLMKLSKLWYVKAITEVYINFIRGTPLLLQLFLMWFVIGRAFNLSAVLSAGIGLGVHNGAYIAEIFRGAIQSIAQGQMEAARSLGMSHWLAMRRIILPQALRRAVPPLGNQFIIALKDSSLASSITVIELMGRARVFISSTFEALPILLIAAAYYLILTNLLVLAVNWVERHLSKGEVRV